MITLLRQHAQSWVIKVLLSIIIVTFIVSFGVGQFTASRLVLVKVGSDDILVGDYDREYERELDRLRQRFPENTESIAAQFNLRKQVYDRMVNRRLTLNEAARTRVIVTDQEVTDTITNQPYFQVSNRFDFNTYAAVLAQNGITPENFENRTRDDLVVAKFQRHLFAGMVVSDQEVEHRFRIENEKVEVDFVLVDAKQFREGITSDEEAERAYYDAHPREFTIPDRFNVRYFVLDLKTVEPLAEVPERAVVRYYERYGDDEFTTPKRVHARHILKKVTPDASIQDEEKAHTSLAEVLVEARNGGDFEALAKAHSEDSSAEQGGDLGFFKREEMVPAFADAAFALEPGTISDIVRSSFGFHIIQAVAVEPAVKKSFAEAQPDILKNLTTQRAERRLELEADRLPARIRAEGLEAVAKEWKTPLKNTGLIDGKRNVSGLGPSRQLYTQVRTGKPGDVGVLRRNPVRGHVFYRIEKKVDSAVEPFDAVKERVAKRVIGQRSAEAAVAAAKAAGESIDAVEAFNAFAEKHGFTIATSQFTATEPNLPKVGRNDEFRRVAFTLGAENPFGVSVNGTRAHLLHWKGRTLEEGDNADVLKREIAAQLEQQWMEFFLRQEIKRLRDRTEIEVITPELITSR